MNIIHYIEVKGKEKRFFKKSAHIWYNTTGECNEEKTNLI